MYAVNVITGAVLIFYAALFWRAYVATVLWSWFVVPVFKVPQLYTLHAAGIMLLIALLRDHGTARDHGPENATPGMRLAVQLGTTFLTPLIALVVAWVIKQWI